MASKTTVRSIDEINDRINEIESERMSLLIDYSKCNDEIEKGIMAQMLIEKTFRVNDLKWVMFQ